MGKTKESWWTAEKVQAMGNVYTDKGLTRKEVGKKYGISESRVRFLFRKFGIVIVKHKSQAIKNRRYNIRSLLPKEVLLELYVDKKLNVKEILKKPGINSRNFYKSLDIHGIPRRGMVGRTAPSPLTYDLLYDMYIEKKMTGKEVAKELGYAYGTISMRLSKLGIKKS